MDFDNKLSEALSCTQKLTEALDMSKRFILVQSDFQYDYLIVTPFDTPQDAYEYVSSVYTLLRQGQDFNSVRWVLLSSMHRFGFIGCNEGNAGVNFKWDRDRINPRPTDSLGLEASFSMEPADKDLTPNTLDPETGKLSDTDEWSYQPAFQFIGTKSIPSGKSIHVRKAWR